MTGSYGIVFWVLLLAIPPGLIAAGFWARGLRREKPPKVPPGEPGNPT